MTKEIHKIVVDGVELLPDIVDTPLWDLIDPDKVGNGKKSDRQLAGLYQALVKRENYFQENSPTAFGNPTYKLYVGMVMGFLQAMELEESVQDDKIVIHRNGKKILIVDQVKRPARYYDDVKDNKEFWNALGL